MKRHILQVDTRMMQTVKIMLQDECLKALEFLAQRRKDPQNAIFHLHSNICGMLLKCQGNIYVTMAIKKSPSSQ